ncbi:hypothetical protein V2J09_005761 [Rumex salicifolius]
MWLKTSKLQLTPSNVLPSLSPSKSLSLSLPSSLQLAMELDPDDVFRDDEDDEEADFFQGNESSKEFVVYLVDASPKMFSSTCPQDNGENISHFQVAISCISQTLKSQIINKSYDEVGICFFNTREKMNMQGLNNVFVFNVAERECLDRPTARLIKDFDCLEETFQKDIGSQYGIMPGSRDNSLYNAIWAAQALLRKGSAKTTEKRILLLTNEDDPFGNIKGVAKLDMMRTTIQRANDAQDLGIILELLPLCSPNTEFNMSIFYADMLGLEGDSLSQFMSLIGDRFEDMQLQLKKRIYKKRRHRRITFAIASGLSIELGSYALIRPTVPEKITWLDSATNVPLKTERSLICSDTGALIHETPMCSQSYGSQDIKIKKEDIAKLKTASAGPLRLLGFKPLSSLEDYHNLQPSTFLFPTDEEVIGSTRVFISLHRAMLRLKRFALAFYGASSKPHLVALVAQDEIISSGGQIEPPGMHMIFLPYSDDIRWPEEHHIDPKTATPCASDEQITKAKALLKRIDLKDFSVCQFSNPALQKHYAVLQALALEEEDMPEVKDETLPDEDGFSRPAIVNALEEFKQAVYGDTHEIETNAAPTGQKRKAIANNACIELEKYDWNKLADSGKLNNLTVVQLKVYLTAHGLPLTGKKEALISRILGHLGK